MNEQIQSEETVKVTRKEPRGSNPSEWTREEFIEAYEELTQRLEDSEQSAKGLQNALKAQESLIEAAIATLMDDIEECPSEGLEESLEELATHINIRMRAWRETQAKNRRHLLDHKRFEKEGVALRQENLMVKNERNLMLVMKANLQEIIVVEEARRKAAEVELAELMREGGGKKKLEKLTASLHKALDEVSKLKTQNQGLKDVVDALHKEKEPPTKGELRKVEEQNKELGLRLSQTESKLTEWRKFYNRETPREEKVEQKG